MSIEVITQFLTISSAEGVSQGLYQNGNPNNVIVYEGVAYPYLSFLYTGATMTRTGDNITSGLALASNAVAMNIASEATQGKWGVTVDTVLMNSELANFTPNRVLSSESWVVTSMSYDVTTVEVELSSAIDAIGLQMPNRVLLSKDVGALPLTSSISNS